MNTTGSLTPMATISGSLSSANITMSGSLSVVDKIEGQMSVPDKINNNIDLYTGEYVINPSFNQQVFETKNKIMTEDVEIKPIAVSVTSNTSGGNTIYIGGIING